MCSTAPPLVLAVTVGSDSDKARWISLAEQISGSAFGVVAAAMLVMHSLMVQSFGLFQPAACPLFLTRTRNSFISAAPSPPSPPGSPRAHTESALLPP